MPSDPSADASRWLNDIITNIDLAQRFAADISYDDFRVDVLRVYAVTRCLEIISEASRRLPAELKARHPSIAWKEIAAAGNIYRHEYENVSARRIWATLRLALPPLRTVTEHERAALGDP
jgi:uncharacterized protein with HEPN domain